MTTISKQRQGTLTIDAVPFQTQATNVRLTPPEQPSGDDAAEVLSGEALPAEDAGGGSGWVMNITAVQDFEDPAGFVNMSWTKEGTTVPYTWEPMGATGPSYSGTVTVWPVEVGGEMNRRLTSDAAWKLGEKPVRAEPGP